MELCANNISLTVGPVPSSDANALRPLWNELQQYSVEISQAPVQHQDIFAFSEDVLLFAIIRDITPPDSDSDSEDETPNTDDPPSFPAIGLVYLTAPHILHGGEINMGIAIIPEYQGCGVARTAVELMLGWAFGQLSFHRVQALIVDVPGAARAVSFFAKMGFVYEGTRRRAVRGATEWCDVVGLALLDTDWLMREYRRPAPFPLWEKLFQRHAHERAGLLQWTGKRLRSGSTETLRASQEPHEYSDPENEFEEDEEEEEEEEEGEEEEEEGEEEEEKEEEEEEKEEEEEEDVSNPEPSVVAHTPQLETSDLESIPSPTLSAYSFASESESSFGSMPPRSASPLSVGSDGSQWDMFDMSSDHESSPPL